MRMGTAGRRPADAGTPIRQDIWDAVRRMDGTFDISAIVAVTGAPRRTIQSYLKCLCAGDYMDCVAAVGAGKPAQYRLLRDTGVHAPRLRPDGTPVTQGRVTEQLWTSMRILKQFTYRDLIETATVPIPEATAKAYCKMLRATGYLKVVRKADPPKGQIALYRLIRASGPKAPQVQRVKRIFDPNTGDVFMQEPHQ